MRSRVGVLLSLVLLLVLAGPAGAQTSCVLTGLYVMSSAVILPDSGAQLAGTLTFSPPGSCVSGASGTVAFDLEALLIGSSSPIALSGTLAYLVDATGGVTIGDQSAPDLTGFVGNLADSVANSVVLVADAGMVGLRIGGVAVRKDLSPATPMAIIVGGGTGGTALATAATDFVPMFDGTVSATEGDVDQAMPVAGTLSDLRVRLDTAPGAGKSYAFTVRKNGADTSVTCTVSEAATSCSDTTNTAIFFSGDLISIESVPTGTPTAAAMRWTAKYTPAP